jgi:HTH-type transcriptional regulator, sugar sensing transcriptional regulator
MLKNLFKELNFSDKEITVYLSLLELGSARVKEIARKTYLNRTSIYDILEVLLLKGIISKYKKGGITQYNAPDPDRLLSYLEREKENEISKIEKQKEKVRQLMPELTSLQNLSSTKPKIQFFEGKKGMREAYEDSLNSKEIILSYANVETMHEALPNFFPNYYKRRVAKKIFIHTILPKNKLSIERSKLNQQELRDSRFLPDEKSTFSPEVNIYNNKILIVSWKEQIAIIIESKEFAELQKITFTLLWDSLPNE